MFSSRDLCAWTFVSAAALSVVVGTHVIELQAQSAANVDARQFEVASVKPTLSPGELGAQAGRLAAQGGAPQPAPVFFGIRTFPGGRFSAVANLRALVARAYGIKDYQIQGGPPWIASDYFAIEARADGDATDNEFNEMLKALLADRFRLRAHMETRQGKVHTLRLGRADGRFGSGLKRTSEECVRQTEERKRNPPPPPTAGTKPTPAPLPISRTDQPPCGTLMMSLGGTSRRLAYTGHPMSMLVERISTELAGPVVDRTELEGLFDIALEYESQAPLSIAGARPGLDPDSTDSPKPPLPMAIERQLGLKLETTTGDLPVIVIDAAAKPMPD